MYNFEQPSDLKIRSAPRFERPIFPFPRNPGNLVRRPAFPPRKRMMSGCYPNIGFRPFVQSPCLANNSIPLKLPPEHRYYARNSAFGTPAPVFPRPAFPSVPFHAFKNDGNQLSLPSLSVPANCNEPQASGEYPERSNQFNEFNMHSDLWVEALAPGGRKYYFNARTRKTLWDKPVNVRIISLDEIERLRKCSERECALNQSNTNQNNSMQQQSNNLYNNSFAPRNIAMPPPRIVTFPPVQNPCNLPPVVPSSNQHNEVCTFSSIIRPAIFQFHENMIPTEETVDHNTIVSCSEDKKDAEQEVSQTNDGEESMCNENRVSDWNISESSISLCSTGNEEELDKSEKMDECIVQEHSEILGDVKIENEVSSNSKHCDSSEIERECEEFKDSVESKNEQQVDKSRPVSSTPVSGTFWNVVWTGDEKVFFYDSQNKISKWERPVELMNRVDVNKLIEKPPSANLKTEKKACKATSNDSDVNKKLKKGDEESLEEDCRLKEKIIDKMDPEKEEKSNLDVIPHERKVEIFLEMLAENNVSAFSTWEKELYKIVPDSRYLILPSKERRQVFDRYTSKILEEEKKARQKEFDEKKNKFIDLLKEAGVSSKSRFNDFARHHKNDMRYKSVEKLRQKENIFDQYVSDLFKREREKEKLLAEQKKKFIELLNEQNFLSESVTWDGIEKEISNDERYKAFKSNSKEKLFKEYIRRKASYDSSNERKERISASIKNREEEVKRNLSIHLKNREKEQEIHKQKSATSNFRALLNDLIRDSDISWHSAKKNFETGPQVEFRAVFRKREA